MRNKQDVKIEVVKLSELTPDDKNANRGTERGLRILDDSISTDGVGRGILLDRRNKIIAGNKTTERAGDRGIDTVIIVETTGNEIVATRRADVDLNTVRGRRPCAF